MYLVFCLYLYFILRRTLDKYLTRMTQTIKAKLATDKRRKTFLLILLRSLNSFDIQIFLEINNPNEIKNKIVFKWLKKIISIRLF